MKHYTKERNELLDRQTRAGVMARLRLSIANTGGDYAGISIFYITTTERRAAAFGKLEADGAIIRERNHQYDSYPYCVFTLPETDGGK